MGERRQTGKGTKGLGGSWVFSGVSTLQPAGSSEHSDLTAVETSQRLRTISTIKSKVSTSHSRPFAMDFFTDLYSSSAARSALKLPQPGQATHDSGLPCLLSLFLLRS